MAAVLYEKPGNTTSAMFGKNTGGMFGKCRSPVCPGKVLQRLATIAGRGQADRAFAQEPEHFASFKASGQNGLPVRWRL